MEGKGVDQWLLATTAQLAKCALLSVLTERAPTTELAKGAPLKMLTPRAPTTALNAHAVRDTVLTNRLPATALLANADRLSVLAGVGLNPNTLGVHAPAFHPLTHNVIDQLLPRAASILLLEALGARALSLAMPAHHLVLNLKQIEWDAVRAERQNGVESKVVERQWPTSVMLISQFVPW